MLIKTTIIYVLKNYSTLRCICSQHLHAYSQFSACAAGVFFSLSEPKDGLPKLKGPCVHVPICPSSQPMPAQAVVSQAIAMKCESTVAAAESLTQCSTIIQLAARSSTWCSYIAQMSDVWFFVAQSLLQIQHQKFPYVSFSPRTFPDLW